MVALGAGITLASVSCLCGLGFVAVPVLIQELVRVTLFEALRAGPEQPPQPLLAKRSWTTFFGVVVFLGALTLGGIAGSGVLQTTLSHALRADASLLGPFLGVSAAGLLLAPLVLVPYASVERARGPGEAFLHAAAITGALPWGSVALISAAVPLLVMTPFAWLTLLPAAPPLLSTLAAAATSTLLTPLIFCGIASSYARCSERLALSPSSAHEGGSAPSLVPSVSIALSLAGLLGVLLIALMLRPSALDGIDDGAPSPRGLGVHIDGTSTIDGTQLHIAAADTGVRIFIDDGGGAGLIEGVPHPTRYRTTPRRDVCRTCFTLEVTNEIDTGRTVLDGAGVRHDDDPTARLARGVGWLAWFALCCAFLSAGIAVGLTRLSRRPTPALLLVIVSLLTAVIDVAGALLR